MAEVAVPASPTIQRRKPVSRKRRRLAVIMALGLVLALAATLVLFALREQIVFFYTPGDLAVRQIAPGTPVRIGGVVKAGTWTQHDAEHRFVITDGAAEVEASYSGMLPDLFREGQGVVAEGLIAPDGSFRASNVLAKHDENYMPKDVVDALKANGQWQHGAAGGMD